MISIKRVLIFLLLCASNLQAQYVQGGGVNAAPDTIGGDWTAKSTYSFTFGSPLASPCTVIVSMRGSGLAISDSQNNQFTLFPGISNILYSNTCLSGADTVTAACPNSTPCWAQFTVSAYSGVWVPDQVSPVTNGSSISGSTSSITPTQNGELIIGIGSNATTNTPGVTAANGFTLRANVNEFIEDLVQTTAAPIASSITYSSAVAWNQTTASFKPGSPPPFVWTMPGFGTFTFPMAIPPDCSDGSCSIVACNAATTPPTCVTITPGQTGSIVIRKPAGDTVVVSSGP